MRRRKGRRKRQRGRKLLELVRFLLHSLPEGSPLRRCCFCEADLAAEFMTKDRGKLQYTLHHVSADRTKACAKTWPLCEHEKQLAHEHCHRTHPKARAAHQAGRARRAA